MAPPPFNVAPPMVNAKHKCIRWKLVKKSLERLVLCSLGLIRSAGYTCSCLTIILLFLLCSLIFSSPFYKGLSALYSLPGYILSLPLRGLEFVSLDTCPIRTSLKGFYTRLWAVMTLFRGHFLSNVAN